MTQHIGIVACTAEGAALCYRTICSEGETLLEQYAHPEVTLHTYPLNEYMRRIEKADWDGVADLMSASAEKAARAGADFIICPDNTIHQAFYRAVRASSRPWLHIAEEVAAEATQRGYRRVGLLGTRYLMESSVYPPKLASRNLEIQIPGEHHRGRIHQIIINEVIHGHLTSASRCYLMELIWQMKDQGCDAVILGCTELPLLVKPKYAALPLLDSTRILARAALRKAVVKLGSVANER